MKWMCAFHNHEVMNYSLHLNWIEPSSAYNNWRKLYIHQSWAKTSKESSSLWDDALQKFALLEEMRSGNIGDKHMPSTPKSFKTLCYDCDYMQVHLVHRQLLHLF